MLSLERSFRRLSLEDVQQNDINVLMWLSTCLIQCILSDWVEVISVVKLDFALAGNTHMHLSLLDILRSKPFYIKEVKRTKCTAFRNCHSPPMHPYSKLLSWFIQQKVKVVNIDLHEQCCIFTLENYFKQFGQFVRHVHSNEKYHRHYDLRFAPTQSTMIAYYCHNLTSCTIDTRHAHDGSVLRVLMNNARLETLHIDGSLCDANSPMKYDSLRLHYLRQLNWFVPDGFDAALVALAKAAPNLQHLTLSCDPQVCTRIRKSLILAVGRACPNLRSFSCCELCLGRNDSVLPPFLALCNKITDLNLRMHCDLTDTVLIKALSELNNVHSLNLRGGCTLSDKTLGFIAQRFASTLVVLYIDQTIYPLWSPFKAVEVEDEEEEAETDVGMREEQQKRIGYTAEGIESLRAQCTKLHTFFHRRFGFDDANA